MRFKTWPDHYQTHPQVIHILQEMTAYIIRIIVEKWKNIEHHVIMINE